ncbi:MAG: hypothetical protein ACO20I_08205 [bacterium]
MCGGTAGDIIKGSQKEADKAIKGVQSAADAAIGRGSSSGKNYGYDLSSISNSLSLPEPNLDQDLAAPVVEAIQDINVPRPNTEQDLTKISVQGLQESAVEQGTQLQQEAINTGTKIQETVVQAGSNLQEAAVQAGSSISGGQSNPTLENAAEQVTTYVEDKVIPVINDVAKFFTENNPAVKLVQETVHEFEKVTPNLELLGSMDLAGGGSVKDTSDPMPSADLDAKDFTGNDDPFGDIETATTKADKMTEEERLRRIRRLMLNRYGREDTILTGAKDPLNRRRYASGL